MLEGCFGDIEISVVVFDEIYWYVEGLFYIVFEVEFFFECKWYVVGLICICVGLDLCLE